MIKKKFPIPEYWEKVEEKLITVPPSSASVKTSSTSKLQSTILEYSTDEDVMKVIKELL